MRPFRSILYVPASNARAMDKSRELPVDAVILDLEDAVPVDDKDAARRALSETLTAGRYGQRAVLVRINGLMTPWGQADVTAFADHAGIDGLVLPKVETVADLDQLASLTPHIPLWAMMETPLAMLNAGAIAAHPRLAGMIMGTNDLAKDLGARARTDRLPVMPGLGICVLAAKAYRRLIVDGVYNSLRDEVGFRAECEQGRDMGFDGKSLIHPAQIATANTVFSPSAEDVDLASRQIAAYQSAVSAGHGVAVLDGRIVENLHVATARATLARAQAIAASTE